MSLALYILYRCKKCNYAFTPGQKAKPKALQQAAGDLNRDQKSPSLNKNINAMSKANESDGGGGMPKSEVVDAQPVEISAF